MPLGWERVNVRKHGPNPHIVFIKPLDGPDKATAQDFLERVAAVCVPIMKDNHLAVVSLEEHKANYEFVGRNFNAGEVIQLVLKSPRTGQWLPFHYVQMVMMHELAHCKQMNHSRDFWAVRNQYAAELRFLWSKAYSGDGLWGRGNILYDGQYVNESLPAGDIPENLCGGTYRSARGKKRKRAGTAEQPKISYAERQQKRIAKKFGVNGMALGNDEGTRVKLEQGKKPKGKPRVAGSMRGRELRAAAALARFATEKQPLVEVKDEALETWSDDGSDAEFDEKYTAVSGAEGHASVSFQGRDMVKVCGDENVKDDPDARQELDELRGCADKSILDNGPKIKQEPFDDEENISTNSEGVEEDEMSSKKFAQKVKIESLAPPTETSNHSKRLEQAAGEETLQTAIDSSAVIPNRPLSDPQSIGVQACEVCSFENAASSLTCSICGHVLDPANLPHYWLCQSDICQESKFRNSRDSGVCSICGTKKTV